MNAQTLLPITTLPYVEVRSDGFTTDLAGYSKTLLAQGPMFRSQRGLEIVTHRLAQDVLRHPGLDADHPSLVRDLGLHDPEVLEFLDTMLLGHGRDAERVAIRRAVMRFFGNGTPALSRGNIRKTVDDLFAEAETQGGEFDLFAEICQRLPSRLWLEWFGGPKEDAPLIARLSDMVLVKFLRDPVHRETVESGYLQLFDYARKRIDAARQTSGGTMLHAMLAETGDAAMTEKELFNFVAMLLEATTDNTSAQMAICIGTLASDPELWERLRATPELRLPAINEAIRLTSRSSALERVARMDIALNGYLVPAGTYIYSIVTAAHLDPEAFEAPETFDPTRANPARNLTFGGGNFFCLGQFLATIEIEEVLSKLLDEYPNFRLTAYEVETGPFINAPSQLRGILQ